MTDIIDKVGRASIEGHDKNRLPAEKDQLVASLWIGMQRTPDGMSQRLQKLMLEGQPLKLMDLDDYIDAVKPVANDPIQQADLAALEFVAARLGSEVMAMRIGRQIFAALRKKRALPTGKSARDPSNKTA